MPTVVLVNGYSASASEILAGALKDNGKATLVGTKTYGKGIIQELHQLSDGSGLKITVSEYYTPNHNAIHKIGITPDVEIDLSEDSKTANNNTRKRWQPTTKSNRNTKIKADLWTGRKITIYDFSPSSRIFLKIFKNYKNIKKILKYVLTIIIKFSILNKSAEMGA